MFVRKTRANCLHVGDLLNLWSEFNVANLNKVTEMFTSCYLMFLSCFPPFCTFEMIVNVFKTVKKHDCDFVKLHACQCAVWTWCGYSIYETIFSWSCLVNNEILHVFQRTPSQLYGVILVLFGMLANRSVQWFLDLFCTFEITNAAWIILYQKTLKLQHAIKTLKWPQ